MKKCSSCGESCALEDFHRNARSGDGRCSRCKRCAKEVAKSHYAKNRETIKARMRNMTEAQRTAKRIRDCAYQQSHSEEKQQYDRARRSANRESIQEQERLRSRQRYADDPERIKAINRKSRMKNWEKRKIRQRDYARERYWRDPEYRARRLLHNRFKQALRTYSAYGKTKSMTEYGVDIEAIWKHLGPCPGEGYHIDHVVPLSCFDLTDDDQVKRAFAPENHQWLLAAQNLEKGARPMVIR